MSDSSLEYGRKCRDESMDESVGTKLCTKV
jgi:hypothetical protein